MSRDSKRVIDAVKAKENAPTVGEIAHELCLPVGDVVFLAMQFGSGLQVVQTTSARSQRDLVIETEEEA